MSGAGWGSDRCLDWQHADGPQEREARSHHSQQHGQLPNLFNHDQPCPDQSCPAANGSALIEAALDHNCSVHNAAPYLLLSCHVLRHVGMVDLN